MTARASIRAKWSRLAGGLLALGLILAGMPTMEAGASTEQIQGSGSSWAFNVVNQWISDVTQQGWQVVFTPSGSAQGRLDFANDQVDFAVSDIGYQGVNPITGGQDTSSRADAYLPLVAGGTSFPYNIVVGGQRVQNLRLSGLTLAKIFTDQITNWDNPEITADNNGHALPSIPIIPVIHSEGAGTTFQFSNWLYTEYPQLWEGFSGYHFPVEYWPTGQGSQVAENGSSQIMNFINSGAGQGSIGFDEYSYAKLAGDPVAAIENQAGYFTLPDAYNVAVVLTQAQINMNKSSPNYLLETLNNVYTYSDPRTYPLSSYTYEIEPTSSTDPTVSTTAKGQTLADFTNYSICQGQAEMINIGYSPLPINLVEASYAQIDLLHGANPAIDLSNLNVESCHNPTFVAGQPNNNYLVKIAPYPPACAKVGQGPCSGQYAVNGFVNGHATAGTPGAAKSTSSSGTTGGASGTSGGSGSASPSGSGSAGGAASSASGASGGSAAGAAANGSSSGRTRTRVGSTGAAGGGPAGTGSGTTSTTAALLDTPTNLGAAHTPSDVGRALIEGAAVVALILLVALPPVAIRRRRRA